MNAAFCKCGREIEWPEGTAALCRCGWLAEVQTTQERAERRAEHRQMLEMAARTSSKPCIRF